ncbi:MAG TPA: hypothetical protein VFV84_12855 [Burkholderiales bacterium]|nr:hypothetical protein [Burkholderiales bacterium]
MTRVRFAPAVGLALSLLAVPAPAAEGAPPAAARYVTVNVEIHGLEEATRALADAARALAATLEDVKSHKKDLTPEQLDRLVAVAREMNELTRAAERTVQESDRALDRARGPVKAIVADVVSTARETGVDPVLRTVHGYVTTWLVISILGGLAALALSLYVFFAISRQLREMVATLRQIAGEYEIVRRTPPA